MILFELILYLISLLVLYLAGAFFVWRFLPKIHPYWQDFLSFCLGISILTYSYFSLGRINLNLVFILILSLAALFVIKNKKDLKQRLFLYGFSLKKNIWPFLGLSLLTLTQSLPVVTSNLNTKEGLVFRSHNFADGLWHVALIRELAKRVPPMHPSNILIKNFSYNYFFDMWGAFIHRFFKVEILHFYFIFYPITISFLFCLLLYLIFLRFKDKKYALLGTAFVVLCGSLSYLLVLFPSYQVDWQESTFWTSQTFSMLINPPFSLSILIIASLSTVFLNLGVVDKKKFMGVGLIIGLISANLIGIKAYAGLLIVAVLALMALIYWRSFLLWLTLAVTIFFLLPLYKWFDKGEFPFFFRPFWFVEKMFEAPDRAYNPSVLYREAIYRLTNQPVKLFIINVYKLTVFLIGNFAFRLLGVGAIFLLLKKKAKTKPFFFFWLILSLLGIFACMFFLQTGVVWNTIQFTYFSLVGLAILMVFVLGEKLKPSLRMIILTFFFLLSLPTTVKSIAELMNGGKQVISYPEQEAIAWLKKNTDLDETIMLELNETNHHYLYVTALSGRRSNYASAHQTELFGEKPDIIEAEIKEVFADISGHKLVSYMKSNQLRYLYIVNDETYTHGFDFSGFDVPFANEKINIYQPK